MLPDIKIMLPLLFVLWCGSAVWAFGSPVMLAYPVMWAAVVGVFLLVSKFAGGGPSTVGESAGEGA